MAEVKYREYGNIELSLNYTLDTLRRFDVPEDVKILDIGTNIGSLPYCLYQRGYKNVFGGDINQENIFRGKEKYKEICDNLFFMADNLAEIRENQYDVILMFDVLEHLPNPKEYMGDIKRILKPHGLFIFQTPNKRINIPYEILSHKSFTAYKSYHCSLQTPRTLYRLLADAGFVDICIERYTIDSDYNRKKIQKMVGPLSGAVIWGFEHMPMGLYPNMWGYARND